MLLHYLHLDNILPEEPYSWDEDIVRVKVLEWINNKHKKQDPHLLVSVNDNIVSVSVDKKATGEIIVHAGGMDFFEKINKYRSEEKMKKIKSKDPYNMNGELTKNIMESITIEKLGQTLNASFLNKGVETATIPNFNFFYRKRMPSYIRFPFINKVSLPKVDFNRRNFEIVNVSSSTSYGSYFISKDDKTQLNKTKIFL